MPFSTIISIHTADSTIDYKSEVFSVGSCFAVNIAEKFSYFQFRNTVNPFGILFHPLAIESFFKNVSDKKAYNENDVFFSNERWHCFDAHSDLSNVDRKKVIDSLNDAVSSSFLEIKSASHIIITLGTAWVYRHVDSEMPVANCHKVPQKYFSKELLSATDIRRSIERINEILFLLNPEAGIIYTVSPVRHLKDGFVENQRSKANLIVGLHDAIIGQPKVSYFPSYEIMMDELRDYRFYAEDMIHPSKLAVDHIWGKFSQAWISPDASKIMDEVMTIRKALAHRPFNSESESHKSFLENLRKRIDALPEKFPHMRF